MYCRPPLVKSMSRSSLSGQSQQPYSATAGDDDSEERPQTTTTSSVTQPLRRDSESKLVINDN